VGPTAGGTKSLTVRRVWADRADLAEGVSAADERIIDAVQARSMALRAPVSTGAVIGPVKKSV
jgi:hypothetical protein